ncbi:MAG: DUF2357 domain-containing protein [Kiritimatiellia bacterium]
MSSFFALRTHAEEYWAGSPRGSHLGFKEHRYQADTIRQALPLEWSEVKPILLPGEDHPRETLISSVAVHCIEDVRLISKGMRRILSRERVMTPVGKVQQLDTYCMRWLMRQPGRDFAEKGGVRQRIMAVVRNEQYDTLENRVFKDFLIRAANLAESYLDENLERFPHHRVCRAVKDFRTVCQVVLEMPEMNRISGLSAMPQPNYVLQQDNRYSKIWDAYRKIVQLANLAEKLWGCREDLKRELEGLAKECEWQVENGEKALFRSRIWTKPLDGNLPIIEKHADWDHTLAGEDVLKRRRNDDPFFSDDGQIGIVDVSGDHCWGKALCIGGLHANAKSRIFRETYPLLDDERGNARKIGVSEIFPVLNQEKVQENSGKLRDAESLAKAYCARLSGEYRNIRREMNELVVLSPDEWNAVTQEIVIRSFPMFERAKIHLLWRSVATVIGFDEEIQQCLTAENDMVSVLDIREDGKVLVTRLMYLKDVSDQKRLVPQRSAYWRNGKRNDDNYCWFDQQKCGNIFYHIRNAKVVCISGRIPATLREFLVKECHYQEDSPGRGRATYEGVSWTVLSDGENGWSQRKGAVSFCHDHAMKTLYYDELEAMWFVGQSDKEEVVKHVLVQANARFKGGATETAQLPAGVFSIGAGQNAIEFLFHIGNLESTTYLHSYKEDFPISPKKNVLLSGSISVSPGQGIAITTVEAPDFFKRPIELDYVKNMERSRKTIETLEEQMRRSFPPTCARVEAFAKSDYERPNSPLNKIERDVKSYLKDGTLLAADTFAKARRKTVADLSNGESKLNLLDRKNVFGNAGGALRPFWLSAVEERQLIQKLLADKCTRLLAWTYRGNLLKPCVARIVDSYCKGARLQNAEVTFLSNCLSEKGMEELENKTLTELLKRLEEGAANGNNLRLFYNLLQFDEKIFDKFKDLFPLDRSVDVIAKLLDIMNGYKENGNPNNYSSCLRVFLYFLRLRKRDRNFMRPKDWFPDEEEADCKQQSRLYDKAVKELNEPISNEGSSLEMLRKVALEYVEGNGTIDGLVMVKSGETDE